MKELRQAVLRAISMFHAQRQHIPLHAVQKVGIQPMQLRIGLPELFSQRLRHFCLGLPCDDVPLLVGIACLHGGVVAQMPVAAEVGSGDERDELGSG